MKRLDNFILLFLFVKFVLFCCPLNESDGNTM